ncbi:MAG: 30S ribosomal protein S11 [Candidatus Gracilibacteria bacterium]|jgi:small subunit ribosomal protein S11
MAKEKEEKKEGVKHEKAEKPAEQEEKEAPKKAKGKARRRIVQVGNAYVNASYNNTIVTLAEPNGNVLAWASSGSSGFKGTRKSTPYAAQIAAENAAEKAKVFGLEKVHIFVKGLGNGREQAIRGLVSKGLDVISITDTTPVPHNGCRKRKARRV